MPRLTNAKLVERALEYKAAKAREAAAKRDAELVRDELLEQLRIRKVDSLELGGVVITRKAKRTRVWSIEGLRKLLPRQLFAELVPPTVNARALDEAVKAGKVDSAKAKDCVVREDESAPYIDVRLVQPAK